MVGPLSLALHTLYADLLEQGADDLFDPDLPENGSLLVRGNRLGAPAERAYYQGYRPSAGESRPGQRYARYLGRVDDPDVAAQIARFQRVKAVRAERTTTVRALIGAGMPRPDRITGRIIEALARAGLFSDNSVLIGEAAYQTYDGVLGVRLAKSQKAVTRDRPPVELVVRSSQQMATVIQALIGVDQSFAADAASFGSIRSVTGERVFVTCLDRADEEARLIDYLIAEPVRAVVLHGPGIPITVPASERYAVHTLIAEGAHIRGVAAAGRSYFDPTQTAELIEALLFADRAHALTVALTDVQKVCPHQRRSLKTGIARLPNASRLRLSAVRGT